jgi:hypothetical protein
LAASPAGSALYGRELVFENGFRIVQQPPDQSALAIVDASCRNETQQLAMIKVDSIHKTRNLTAENPARLRRNQSRSDSRKGAKDAKEKRISTLRSWRLGAIKRISFLGLKNLRKLRKLLSIVVQRSQKAETCMCRSVKKVQMRGA